MTNINYLYNPAVSQEFFGKDHFVGKVLHFQIIERGTILPHKHMSPPSKCTSCERSFTCD